MNQLDTLQQGAMKHVEFRAKWDRIMEEFEDNNMEIPSERQLYLKYLMKLNQPLRTAIMAREWPLDGIGEPHRNPGTQEEVALACSMAHRSFP